MSASNWALPAALRAGSRRGSQQTWRSLSNALRMVMLLRASLLCYRLANLSIAERTVS
ncbi:hypothetical protein [Hydrocarboniphaga effusa]|uniref:hypothetical protein n=1 Tax=Hydrocarboniphaga effusa TaxID=243629 RepID=UPI00398C1E9E